MANLFRIRYTRSAVIYVLADTLGSAREDADELTPGTRDWDDDEVDVRPANPMMAQVDARLWTGGPDGDWTTVGEVFAAQPK